MGKSQWERVSGRESVGESQSQRERVSGKESVGERVKSGSSDSSVPSAADARRQVPVPCADARQAEYLCPVQMPGTQSTRCPVQMPGRQSTRCPVQMPGRQTQSCYCVAAVLTGRLAPGGARTVRAVVSRSRTLMQRPGRLQVGEMRGGQSLSCKPRPFIAWA